MDKKALISPEEFFDMVLEKVPEFSERLADAYDNEGKLIGHVAMSDLFFGFFNGEREQNDISTERLEEIRTDIIRLMDETLGKANEDLDNMIYVSFFEYMAGRRKEFEKYLTPKTEQCVRQMEEGLKKLDSSMKKKALSTNVKKITAAMRNNPLGVITTIWFILVTLSGLFMGGYYLAYMAGYAEAPYCDFNFLGGSEACRDPVNDAFFSYFLLIWICFVAVFTAFTPPVKIYMVLFVIPGVLLMVPYFLGGRNFYFFLKRIFRGHLLPMTY